jgi:replicative DNA helicase
MASKAQKAAPSHAGLPNNEPAERAVLGSILLDNAVFGQAAALSNDDFALEKHRRIWRAMQTLHEKNRPFMIDEMRRSIPKHATLSVIRRIHSVQLEIRRSTLEKE